MELGCYLDEVDDNPTTACSVVGLSGIKTLCLRDAWGVNIASASDTACKTLMAAIRANKLSVDCLCSDLGSLPRSKLLGQERRLNRAILIAAYFGAKFLRVSIGDREPNLEVRNEDGLALVNAWLAMVVDRCKGTGLIPLVEVETKSSFQDVESLNTILSSQPSCRLLYDPVAIVAAKRQSPIPYWEHLKDYVGAIDIHDYKIGVGYRPAGHGDCGWPIIDTGGFTGPCFLEPGLGWRYGSAVTRGGTFSMALGAARQLSFLRQ